jgi:hypothetical protein
VIKDIHKKKQKNATTSNGGHTIKMRHKTCVKKVSLKVKTKVIFFKETRWVYFSLQFHGIWCLA